MNRPEPLRYFLVDAFTDRPFRGNPAAVVPLTQWRDDDWLQCVAREMNLSETAYCVPNADGFDIRWFTPKLEVDLCGHATLATAKVLSHLGRASGDVNFASHSGKLAARIEPKRITLDFPRKTVVAAEPLEGIVEAIGIEPEYVGRHNFDYLLEYDSEAVVRKITPNFALLGRTASLGVIVTARSSDPQFDFVSRFFAPAFGIDEDPVTGSAHCMLADHWYQRIGRSQFRAYQASARGGVVDVKLEGDRVSLGGQAVIVAQGELFLD